MEDTAEAVGLFCHCCVVLPSGFCFLASEIYCLEGVSFQYRHALQNSKMFSNILELKSEALSSHGAELASTLVSVGNARSCVSLRLAYYGHLGLK